MSDYSLLVRYAGLKTPENREADGLVDAYLTMTSLIRNPTTLSVSIFKSAHTGRPPVLVDRIERTGGVHGYSTKPSDDRRSQTTDRRT